MSDTLGLGKIITTEQHRDAIHVAVAPVVAGCTLVRCQHVGLAEDGTADAETDNPIGIVDPFLTVRSVKKGQRFWLFLYPGSITSLRHDWTHPAFESPVPAPLAAAAPPLTRPADFWRTPTVLAIARSMRESGNYEGTPILADALEEAGYNDASVLAQLRDLISGGFPSQRLVCLVLGGELVEAVEWLDRFSAELDLTYNALMEAAALWIHYQDHTVQHDSETWREKFYGREEAFWERYEIVTGNTVEDKGARFFSCSC